MYCPDCGKRNEDRAQFCSGCGISFRGGRAPGPASAPVLEPHELVRQASELKDRGQLEEAIELCRRAILAEPRHRGAHALLGLVYEKKGQTSSAIREYRVVLEIDPNSTAEREKLDMLLGRSTGTAAAMVEPTEPARVWSWQLPALAAAVLLVGLAALASSVIRDRQDRQQQPESSVAMARPRAAGGNATPEPAPTARVARAQPARTPYPALSRSASPFGTAQASPPRVSPRLPTPMRSQVTPRTNTSRLPTAQASRRLPMYETRLPPLVPGVSPEEPARPGRSVVTPLDEGPLEVRPGPVEPETPSGAIEVVGETGDEEMAGTTGHIEIWPSEGVRARTPRPAAPAVTATPEAPTQILGGRSHQLAAGQLRQQGRYTEAIAGYESAIAAYTQSIDEGSAGPQAAKGIESCKRAIAACQAALAEQ